MTWHALSFLLSKFGLLLAAAGLFFLAGAAMHHGWLNRERSAIRLIIALAITIVSSVLFAHILRGVLTDGKLVQADRRLYFTLRLFRSERLHLLYSSISDLGSIVFTLPPTLGLVVIFWLARRKREAIVLAIAFAAANLLGLSLKYLVHRERPPEAQLFMHGPSFPSGHTLAAAVIYGFIAYLLLRDPPWKWWRLVAAIPLLALIGLMPLARVYLGVHWAYDTLASLALGCAVLAIAILLFKFSPFARLIPESPRRDVPWLAPALGIFSTIVTGYAAALMTFDVQQEARPSSPSPRSNIAVSALQQYPSVLRKNSEDLVGGPMEPVALMFVAEAPLLVSSFEHAGWSLAQLPSGRRLAHELACVIANRPDPNGPATPSYFDSQPQDLTFERPGTSSGSIRHRHHTRIWRTAVLVAGQPLWVATCSYDEAVKFVAKPYLITHRIDPDVDKEREMIDQQLRAAGARELGLVTVTGPERGHNAGGDGFFTDGRAHVLALP